jgi:hypothetical protein
VPVFPPLQAGGWDNKFSCIDEAKDAWSSQNPRDFARLDSTRLLGKVLLNIGAKPMVQWAPRQSRQQDICGDGQRKV